MPARMDDSHQNRVARQRNAPYQTSLGRTPGIRPPTAQPLAHGPSTIGRDPAVTVPLASARCRGTTPGSTCPAPVEASRISDRRTALSSTARGSRRPPRSVTATRSPSARRGSCSGRVLGRSRRRPAAPVSPRSRRRAITVAAADASRSSPRWRAGCPCAPLPRPARACRLAPRRSGCGRSISTRSAV